MSENRRDEDCGTSASGSTACNKTSYKRQSEDASWDASQMMKKPKQNQLSPVSDSEMALVNTYLEHRRARRPSQPHRGHQIPQDSDTTESDSEDSASGASSWEESDSEPQPSPASVQSRSSAQRQRNPGRYQIRERLCLHCKAVRTNEWLMCHFPQSSSETASVKGDGPEDSSTPEENPPPDTNTKRSKF